MSGPTDSNATDSNENPSLATLGLPPIDQVGFVVKSIAATEERYGALFGPWTHMDGSVEGATYRGRVCDAKLELLFGHSGDLEIEFIEWQGGESPHREFIEAGREGMHHLRYRVDDHDATVALLAELGYASVWSKRLDETTAFSYLERDGDPLVIEILEMPT